MELETLLEEEKMMVTNIFSFLTVFYKAFFFRVIKSWDCVVKNGTGLAFIDRN